MRYVDELSMCVADDPPSWRPPPSTLPWSHRHHTPSSLSRASPPALAARRYKSKPVAAQARSTSSAG
jgi:hypothetical protein